MGRAVERTFRSIGRGFEEGFSKPFRKGFGDEGLYGALESVTRGTADALADVGGVMKGIPQKEALEEQQKQFAQEQSRIDAENARAKAESDFQKQVAQTASSVAQGQAGAEEASQGATVAFQDKLKAKVNKDKLLKALRI